MTKKLLKAEECGYITPMITHIKVEVEAGFELSGSIFEELPENGTEGGF